MPAFAVLFLVSGTVAGESQNTFTIDNWIAFEEFLSKFSKYGREDQEQYTITKIEFTTSTVETDEGTKKLTKAQIEIQYFDFRNSKDANAQNKTWANGLSYKIFKREIPKRKLGEIKEGSNVLLSANFSADYEPTDDGFFESVSFAGPWKDKDDDSDSLEIFSVDDFLRVNKLVEVIDKSLSDEDRLSLLTVWKNKYKGKVVFIEGKVAKVFSRAHTVETDDGISKITKFTLHINYFDLKKSSKRATRKRRWPGRASAMTTKRIVPKSKVGKIKKGTIVYLEATLPSTAKPSLDNFFKSIRFLGTKKDINARKSKVDSKKEKPEDGICSECDGRNVIPCPNCGGSKEVGCFTCGGDGIKKCSNCNGSGRKEVWVPGRGGYTYFEDCKACNGTGTRKCGSCKGSGKVECRKCKGRGEIDCPKCNGR
jgi:hypothetical protein